MAAYTRTQCRVYACTVPPVACRPFVRRFRVDFTPPIWTSFVPKLLGKVPSSFSQRVQKYISLFALSYEGIPKLHTIRNVGERADVTYVCISRDGSRFARLLFADRNSARFEKAFICISIREEIGLSSD